MYTISQMQYHNGGPIVMFAHKQLLNLEWQTYSAIGLRYPKLLSIDFYITTSIIGMFFVGFQYCVNCFEKKNNYKQYYVNCFEDL